MTYSINDDELPHAVISGLEAKGWRFDQGEQEWRLHNDAGRFSPHRADHARQWPSDVDAVVAALDAAAAGSTGDQMSSASVKEADTNLLAMAKMLFTADAAKTGNRYTWDTASDGMRDHFIRLAAKKLDTTPAAADHPAMDGTGYYEDTREDLKPSQFSTGDFEYEED